MPDRQRPEAVEDTLGDVGVQPHPGVHRDEHNGLDQDARQEELQVRAGRAGQGAAEEVGEHQGEHDRERGHVEELLGDVLYLQQRPPPESERSRQDVRSRRPGTGGQRRAQRFLADGLCCGGRRRHAASSSSSASSFSAGRPVRARNTSSRLGWPSAKSVIATPDLASSASACATGSGSETRAESAAGSDSRCTGTPSARESTRSASDRSWGSRSRKRRAPEPIEALSSPGVPSAMTRPWSMTAILSANWSASSRYWVVKSTVVPPATRARMMSHTWLRLLGSRPAVGSSRNMRSGVTTMLAAMSSRRRMPPEYFLT